MNQNIRIDEEQKICLSCGICCDGTLFGKAVLQPGEKGSLPKKMEEAYFKADDGEFFKLPCSYFSGKCTIYHKKKAHVCSSFKCKLLLQYSKGEVRKEDALKIIKQVKIYRKEIEELAFKNHNIPLGTPFIILQVKLKEIKLNLKPGSNQKYIENLIAKCIILEILLKRYFLS